MNERNIRKYIFLGVRHDIWICLLLVVATFIVYWQVRNFEFVNFDDSYYILENNYVKDGITVKGIVWAFSHKVIDYWRPISWLSHMLDCHLYGLNPGMHHASNLIIHIVSGILLFHVLKLMTGTLWRSAFVAALFLLHPLNVESVAWVAERKNVLSTLFWMITMLVYVGYVRRPGIGKYLLLLLVFSIGLMTKPTLITLPFVLLLLDYWPLCRFEVGQAGCGDNNEATALAGSSSIRALFFRLCLEKVPMIVLSAVSVSLTILSVPDVIALEIVPMKMRVANALVSYLKYIGAMFWPHRLAFYYPPPEAIPLWQATGAGFFLICISLLVLRVVRTRPYVVGWLWYIGTLLPAIGLLQSGLWPAIADRFVYVPLIGLFIMISWGVADLSVWWRHRKVVLAAVAAVVLLALMAKTWTQTAYWTNSSMLFNQALKVTRNNSIAHNELAKTLAKQNRLDEAIDHYLEALRINPIFDDACYNLGIAFTRKGNDVDAISYYKKGLQIKPDNAKAHNNLGSLYIRMGNIKDAVYHYHEALRIDPSHAGSYYNLGKIYNNQGKITDAILNYRNALHLKPNMTQALYNLSWIFATHENDKIRNGEEAVKLAEKLCKITQYKQSLALDALAAAYAETGRFDAAVSTAQKGHKLALLYGPKELVLGLKKRLRLYKVGRPYRQTQP
ncbi:MAG: hypothetical protein BBJ57_13635 [Desulfobacterales bacterium PC51MH44]|nr:MAG: hypothetical protein BBJ57_13635 [Desulfobacterales bacterium PC51MH44]